MPDEESLQGWVPVVDSPETLSKVIDDAFDYRGDVTIDKADGTEIVGYLCNKGKANGNGFVEIIPTDTFDRIRLNYADIKNVRFSGKDMAAGQSWEAWQKRREANAHDSGEE